MRTLAVVAVTAVALLSSGCGGSDGAAETTAVETTAESSATDTSVAGLSEDCEAVDFPEPQPDVSADRPAEALDAAVTFRLKFSTSCGDFTVTLDQTTAPATAASLVALARAGYFDGTLFHRIVPGFVIQGGDPTQTGGGGPGYQTVDVPPPDTAYTKGVVAMAKASSEAPGTSGSQFFVVTADDAGLPPEYAVVGTVTDGLDVVETIGALGDEFEQPTQPIVIHSVTVDESK